MAGCIEGLAVDEFVDLVGALSRVLHDFGQAQIVPILVFRTNKILVIQDDLDDVS